MALVTCHDCQSQISDAAPACPRCGRPAPGAIAQAARVGPTAKLSGVQCPNCGATTALAPGKKNASCEFCGAGITTGGAATDAGALFPNFRRRPIPCPNCDKKSLRPRVRTRDFRCQACSTTYPGEDIEARIERMLLKEHAEQNVTGIIKGILARHVPKQYWSDAIWEQWVEKRATDETTIGVAGCLWVAVALLGSPAALFFWLNDWSLAGRIGMSVLGLFGGGFAAWVPVAMAESVGKSTSRQRSRQERAEWERANAILSALLKVFGGLFFTETFASLDARRSQLVEDDERTPTGEDAGDAHQRAIDRLHVDVSLQNSASAFEAAMRTVRYLGSNPEERSRVDAAVGQYGTEEERGLYAHEIRLL